MARGMMRPVEYEDSDPYVIIEKNEGGVGAFLIGVAVGAGIALLFAPQSGAATRARIQRTARDARDRAQEYVGDARERVTERFNEARGQVEERIDAARRAIDLKRRQVTRAVHAGRAAAEEAREELERRIADTKSAYRDAGESGGGAAGGSTV